MNNTNAIADFSQQIKPVVNELSENSGEPKWYADVLDMSVNYGEIEYYFCFGNIMTIPKGEMIGITGRAKQGKSQFTLMLIAALIGTKGECYGIRRVKDVNKIIVFDTEQSKATLQQNLKRAFRAAGIPDNRDNEKIVAISMRKYSAVERMETIKQAIEKLNPDIIIIDGIRDLIHDFNDLKETEPLITELLKISDSGISIIGVLHQNKDDKDRNMRGHLGTEFANKCCDVFEVTKENEHFKVEHLISRNITIQNYNFMINDDGNLSTWCNIEIDNDTKKIFEDIFEKSGTTNLSSEELQTAYSLRTGVKRPTAKKKIYEAREKGIIFKNVGKRGTFELAKNNIHFNEDKEQNQP